MRHPFQVWQDVYAVGGPDISHPADCCVYLVDAGELVLIDSGAGQSFSCLVDNIKHLGFDPQRLTTLIITHAHIDHIGALADFQRDYGVRLVAHELEVTAIEGGHGTGAEFYGVVYQPCPVDYRMAGSEQSLTLGNYQFHLVHIPGHTPGSIVVYLDMGKRVLFGQDVHGPYLPEWGADLDQARSSLQRMIDIRADILCEGHFGIYQPASEVEQYIDGYLRELSE